MKQPDNFGFGEEAAMLKTSARKFFEDNCPVDQLHALVAHDPTPDRMPECRWDQDLWRQMAELGWSGLAVPESLGGVGMPLVGVAGLAEELGRAACPSPLLSTLNASLVLAACGDGGGAALEEIAGGRSATLVCTDQAGSWEPLNSNIVFRDGALHGTAWFVQDARKSEHLLVVARSEHGLQLFWVASDTPGVEIVPDALLDLTRDQAHVQFSGVAAGPLEGDAEAALTGAFPAIWTLLAADMVGAAEWQLQTTIEYVNARQQFDRPLGFFQAVKHPLVNVMLKIDESKSLVYNAACALDTQPERAARFAHMAKSSASDTAAFASARTLQCHGGIGFTWECYLHLYFKRQKHSQFLWGDGPWHRDKLAAQLI